jgi:hypothetical protein
MNELKNKGPDLTSTRKELLFNVPEGYFENFSVRLNHRIHAENRIPSFTKYLSSWKPYLAAAVILIIAIITGNFLYNNHTGKRAGERLNTEISQVVEHELYYISEETILEVTQTDVQNIPVGTAVNNDEMIDYLLNEDLNEKELVNAM